MKINGKEYTLWNQFVETKNRFIGGTLQDLGDHEDDECSETEIVDIVLEPNGNDSAFFSVVGHDFECGFDCNHGGIVNGNPDWITFSGYGGHTWRIKPWDINN